MNLELMSHETEELKAISKELQARSERLLATAEQDGENIRALARIAEIHERRLTSLEGNHE